MTSQERHVLGQHAEHEHPTTQREQADAVVQLREEELAARKQQVEAGRVSLGTEVVEEEKTLEVPVTHEEVTVERRPVDRRPSDAPIQASSDVMSVPVRAEQISVDKQPVVYEEVNVGKRAIQDHEHVSDTVRKEVLDVDATGDVDVSEGADRRR
jgi:uncharacterized protein (TIGR02271 family)